MDGTTGGRCQASHATRGYHRKDPQEDFSASCAERDGDSANDQLTRKETVSDGDEGVDENAATH